MRILGAASRAAAWISVIPPINRPNLLPGLRNLRQSWVSLIRGPVFIAGQRMDAHIISKWIGWVDRDKFKELDS